MDVFFLDFINLVFPEKNIKSVTVLSLSVDVWAEDDDSPTIPLCNLASVDDDATVTVLWRVPGAERRVPQMLADIWLQLVMHGADGDDDTNLLPPIFKLKVRWIPRTLTPEIQVKFRASLKKLESSPFLERHRAHTGSPSLLHDLELALSWCIHALDVAFHLNVTPVMPFTQTGAWIMAPTAQHALPCWKQDIILRVHELHSLVMANQSMMRSVGANGTGQS